MKHHLDALVEALNVTTQMQVDPVSFVHRYHAPRDQELVGLVAATLAFGNVTAIRRSVTRVLDVLGEHPSEWLANCSEKTLHAKLKDFVHRVYRGPDVARMLWNAKTLQATHGSLGEFFAHTLRNTATFREALAMLADQLRGELPASRGLRHLLSDPRAGSACKRWLLYLRWMIRGPDGLDIGCWPVDPACLVIPMDTHVHRIARNLGLTQRKDASWRTAEEVTAALRKFDPDDPVKYDFALCHLGISRACPSQRVDDKCNACVLKPVCVAFARGV